MRNQALMIKKSSKWNYSVYIEKLAMRITAIFLMCTFIACLFSEGLSLCQPPHNKNAKIDIPTGTRYTKECQEYTCRPDGSWVIKQCPEITCSKQIGYVETDNSKQYPGCCAHAICQLKDPTH